MKTLIHKKRTVSTIEAEAQTICGNRLINQDRFYLNHHYERKSPDDHYETSISIDPKIPICFAVADGVGGASYGEIASKIAIDYIHEWQSACSADEEDIIAAIRMGFGEINQRIIDYSDEMDADSATTLTALIFFGNKFYLANVGDSPAFMIRQSRLLNLFDDQSFGGVNESARPDKITKKSNLLLYYLGNRELTGEDMVHITRGTYQKNDCFMLFTDGVTKTLGEKRILELMDKSNVELSILFQELEKTGADDNSTGILARVK